MGLALKDELFGSQKALRVDFRFEESDVEEVLVFVVVGIENPEVRQVDLVVVIQQNVVHVQISMGNPENMKDVQGQKELQNYPMLLLLREIVLRLDSFLQIGLQFLPHEDPEKVLVLLGRLEEEEAELLLLKDSLVEQEVVLGDLEELLVLLDFFLSDLIQPTNHVQVLVVVEEFDLKVQSVAVHLQPQYLMETLLVDVLLDVPLHLGISHLLYRDLLEASQ